MKSDFNNEAEGLTAEEIAAARAIAEEAAATAQQNAEANGAQEAAPQPTFAHVLAVWFNYFRADGTQGSDRVFIFDCPDIRNRAQIQNYEALLAEQGNFSRVLITNWRKLEG